MSWLEEEWMNNNLTTWGGVSTRRGSTRRGSASTARRGSAVSQWKQEQEELKQELLWKMESEDNQIEIERIRYAIIQNRLAVMGKIMSYIGNYTKLFSDTDLYILSKMILEFMEECINEILGILRNRSGWTTLRLDVYDAFTSLIEEIKHDFVNGGTQFFNVCLRNWLDEVSFGNKTLDDTKYEDMITLGSRYRELGLRLKEVSSDESTKWTSVNNTPQIPSKAPSKDEKNGTGMNMNMTNANNYGGDSKTDELKKGYIKLKDSNAYAARVTESNTIAVDKLDKLMHEMKNKYYQFGRPSIKMDAFSTNV